MFSDFYKSLEIKVLFELCLGLENLFPNSDGTNDSFMCTYEELNELFKLEKIIDLDLYLLLDLGHLAISSNILKFDRYEYIDKCINKFSEKIF